MIPKAMRSEVRHLMWVKTGGSGRGAWEDFVHRDVRDGDGFQVEIAAYCPIVGRRGGS